LAINFSPKRFARTSARAFADSRRGLIAPFSAIFQKRLKDNFRIVFSFVLAQQARPQCSNATESNHVAVRNAVTFDATAADKNNSLPA
jgi:hypothetical protein